MKKIFYLVTAVTLFVLGTTVSCSKFKQQIDDIEKHVDIIESTRITPLEEQVKSITESIGDLKNLKSTLDKVVSDLEVKGKDITELKEARTSIEKRIGELEAYVEDLKKDMEEKLGNYAEKDWVEKTFATKEELEKTYNELADYIAFFGGGVSYQLDSLKGAVSALDKRADGLDDKIDSLDVELKKALGEAIDQCEKGLKKWVATQLEGYYTIAQANSLLAAMSERLDSTDKALSNAIKDTAAALNERLDSVSKKLNKDLSDLKEELEGVDKSLNYRADSLAEEIKALDAWSQTHIANLRDSVNTILDSLGYFKGQVEALNESVKESLDSIDRAKKTITAEYKKAIEDAISANDGYITTTIKNKFNAIDDEITGIKNNYNVLASRVSAVESQISEINSSINAINVTISGLETSVGELQTDVEGLKSDVSKLQGRIQSVIFVPEYSGGTAYASYIQEKGPKTKEYRDLNLSFRITPAAGAKKLKAENLCLDYRQVKTKADASKLSVSSVVVTSEAEGIVRVTVPASEMNRVKSYFEGGNNLACCLIIKTDDENLTSNYFDVKAEEYIGVKGISFKDLGANKNINIDSSLDLNEFISFDPSEPSNKSLTWSSNKPSIATVGENSGIVTPVSVGDVTITATSVDDPTKEASVTIRIKADVSSIELDKSELKLVNDGSEKSEGVVKVTAILPEQATVKEIEKWEVTPAGVVEIKPSDDKMSCTVTAKKKGTATLTAKAKGFNVTATCTITVTDVLVESITLDKEIVNLKLSLTESEGKATVNVSEVLPANASDKNVTWSFDSEEFVKIESQDGTKANIKALKEGSATLTATAKDGSGVTASCTVNVTEIKVTGLTLSESKLEWTLSSEPNSKEAKKVEVSSVTPENAYNKTVEWTIADSSIAEIKKEADGSCKVKPLKEGETTITATSNSDKTVKRTCTITVNTVKVESITLSPSKITLNSKGQGENKEIKITILPANAYDKGITWEIGDTGLAKISEKTKDGVKVSAVKNANGNTTLTAKTKDGSELTATCAVTVLKQ